MIDQNDTHVVMIDAIEVMVPLLISCVDGVLWIAPFQHTNQSRLFLTLL